MSNNRTSIRSRIVDQLLHECFHRCCFCPEHRRISEIHHIDEDRSNNSPANLIALCRECHADVHSDQKLRRNISPSQLRLAKAHWGESCNAASRLFSIPQPVKQWSYVHLHRIAPLYKQITGKNLFSGMPYRFKNSEPCLNTLWHNRRSSLSWQQHLELRDYLNECADTVFSADLKGIGLGMLEIGVIDPESAKGHLVHFSAAFHGQDIPSQTEFVIDGEIVGPPGTLRRSILDEEGEAVLETCILLEPRYYYSDSTFVHFSESGYWNGLAMLGSIGNVGSNDGHLSRIQLRLSPICIGSPQTAIRIFEDNMGTKKLLRAISRPETR